MSIVIQLFWNLNFPTVSIRAKIITNKFTINQINKKIENQKKKMMKMRTKKNQNNYQIQKKLKMLSKIKLQIFIRNFTQT